MQNWQTEIETELEAAAQARERGNEGQARVCARRAAGVALREHFRRKGQEIRNPSAYDLLQRFAALPENPAPLRQFALRLTLRVNESFQLPPEIDLLEDARLLCQALLLEDPQEPKK